MQSYAKTVIRYMECRELEKRGLENHIEWNWLYKDLPNLECNHFESIIFIPKPSSRSIQDIKRDF